ncbi:hypothetical protein WKK05_40870 (plasmid) [Nostoc sp. UHCC 0302]|uniref:hypothetical protein n=1 Tax=Nostoc sp. UHCC 0302 TaxID=3134896 RepID=UPI00311CDFF0
MTHIIYSQQQLQLKSIARLKQIYSEIGCTLEVQDKRCKDSWITAIIDYQSAQAHKVVDEQVIAQAELNNYVTAQAQAVAPEQLTPVEISFDHHEYYAGNQLIASISHDDDHLTQRWVVMVEGVEKFRANTWARCHRFILWHLNNSQLPSRNSQLNTIPKSKKFYTCNDSIHNCELRTANCKLHQQGTLNTLPIPQVEELTFLEISYYDQEVHIGDYHTDSYLVASISFDHDNYEDLYWRVMINGQEIYRDITPALCYEYIKQQYQQGTLPVQEQLPEEICTTSNEIMSQIFNECEKFGFDILDDGIYNGDRKLGEVGQTNDSWWFTRAADDNQQRIPCDSVLDAVWWLSMVEVLSNAEVANCEQLLDLPFEQLTTHDWQRLREYEPVAA